MSIHDDSAPSKEDIEKIFAKYYLEEYIPEGKSIQRDQPKYTPTPINTGPKAITIEEYLSRNRKKQEQKQEKIKKTKRGGKKIQKRKQRKELVRKIGLSYGQEKRQLYVELQRLNGKSKFKNQGGDYHKQQQQ